MGMGTLGNILPALMADYFAPEERQGMMGNQVVFASIGAMIFMYLTGKLGTISWNSAYLVYIYAAVVLVVCAILLPKVSKQNADGTTDTKIDFKQVLSPNVLIIAIFGLMFLVVNNGYNNNYSLLISQHHLGGSDVAGLISTIGQVGGLLAGFSVGMIAKKMQAHMLSLTWVTLAIALLIAALVPTLPAQFIAGFLVNASMSFYYASSPFMITVLVEPRFIPMGMAVLNIFSSIGGFMSPFIINGLNNATLGGKASGAMGVSAALAILVAIFFIATNFQKKALQSTQAAQTAPAEREAQGSQDS